MSKLASSRQRRIKRVRRKIIEQGVTRLMVHRTSQHIYAQIVSANDANILASASSLDKCIRDGKIEGGKSKVAEAVGNLIAERAISKGISKVAFDRSGFRYHGRLKALADSARAGGLEF